MERLMESGALMSLEPKKPQEIIELSENSDAEEIAKAPS
jgi:hypothetical protein